MITFTYEALSASSQEIRLLDVENTTRNSPQGFGDEPLTRLSCRMRRVSLMSSSIPSYETISYCWGDPAPSEAIVVDDQIMRVPVNTLKALLHLVPRGQARTLWIDAICINQADREERGQQVALMGHIYHSGTANLIYLGEDVPTTNRALQNVRDLHRELTETLDEGQNWQDLYWPPRRETTPLKTHLDVDALVALYAYPWFTRLWVMQEMILGVNNICVLGSVAFDPEQILAVAVVLFASFYDVIPASLRRIAGFYNAGLLWRVQQSYRESRDRGGVVLYRALTAAQELECSEARDKVFGVLGITITNSSLRISTAAKWLLASDYNKSIADVYRDATRFCVIQSGRLDVLSEVTHRNNRSLTDGSASWKLPLDRHTDQRTDANALTHISRSREMLDDLSEANMPSAEQTPGDLRACGFVVDVIAESTDSLEPDISTGEVSVRMLQVFINASVAIARRSQSSMNDLARTMTANRDQLGRPWHEGPQRGRLESLCYEMSVSIRTARSTALLQTIIDESNSDLANFCRALEQACRFRRLYSTQSGILGLANAVILPGDVVAYLYPARNPCVLRPHGEGKYLFLGECYVDALQDDRDITQYPMSAEKSVDWLTIC